MRKSQRKRRLKRRKANRLFHSPVGMMLRAGRYAEASQQAREFIREMRKDLPPAFVEAVHPDLRFIIEVALAQGIYEGKIKIELDS